MADALHRSPADVPPVLTAAGLARHGEIRIADQGPVPQQVDATNSLALRLARDLTKAMSDTLRCEETLSGRTVILTLPAATRRPPAPPSSISVVAAPKSADAP